MILRNVVVEREALLYLVGPLLESRPGDGLFDSSFVICLSFSMQMPEQKLK
jgi:hypothetical protein